MHLVESPLKMCEKANFYMGRFKLKPCRNGPALMTRYRNTGIVRDVDQKPIDHTTISTSKTIGDNIFMVPYENLHLIESDFNCTLSTENNWKPVEFERYI
jgi:hypothetical protein